MKRAITIVPIIAVALLQTLNVQGQFINTGKKKDHQINWQNLSPENGDIYGISLDKAYSLLKDRKAKKEVVVALIGPGIDVEHEDLQGSLWTNRNEKLNEKDDDKNSKIDDINGWNFLGNSTGDVLEEALGFGDREFFRLKDQYGDLQFDGTNFYVPNEAETEMVKVEAPRDMDEFFYFTKDVRKTSSLASKYAGLQVSKMMRAYIHRFDAELKMKYPGQDDYTLEEFLSLKNDDDSLHTVSLFFMNVGFSMSQSSTYNGVSEYLRTKQKESGLIGWNRATKGVNPDDRSLVGDKPYEIKDSNYGNNILLTENAGEGTMYAGIIAAQRDNQTGIDGIASNAKVMTLRTNPNKGDAYLKDVALAIRYAVEQGADIIQLTQPIQIYPYGDQRDWINDALVYAESKNVLIVQPVNDLSYDIDQEVFFPSKKISETKTLKNFITVAASDMNGNPLINTNFGIENLDLFAPGKDIYSSYTGDTYRSESGSHMAASVVSGVAALIKSYFPSLTAEQLRTVLMSSVTDRSDAEVEKQAVVYQDGSPKMTKDLFLFEDLCVSGGIVNAAKAVEEAVKQAK